MGAKSLMPLSFLAKIAVENIGMFMNTPEHPWYFISNFRSISIFQEPEYFRVEGILGIMLGSLLDCINTINVTMSLLGPSHRTLQVLGGRKRRRWHLSACGPRGRGKGIRFYCALGPTVINGWAEVAEVDFMEPRWKFVWHDQ